MLENKCQLQRNYDELGYFVIRNYFNDSEMAQLRAIVLKFHQLWQQDNATFYQEEAFNSSLITGSEYLSSDDRVKLFNFISSKKVMDVVESVIVNNPAFMNTQLFFNPVNPEQKDFWHRDCQYDHDIEGQKTGKKISLAAGDLLVFSADMIHRGLYGLDRLALDILVFDSAGDFADYVDDDCLPDNAMLAKIDDPRLFINTINLKSAG